MKGRRGGGDAVTVSYFSGMDGSLGSLGVPKDVGASSGNSSGSSLRRRIGTILRSSTLGSACSLTARNVSQAVQEPVFVSSRRLSSGDFRRLERLPSLPSSTASTTISSTSNAAADPRRGLLEPRHRRSRSFGSAPGAASGSGVEVDLGICRPARKDRRASGLESGGKVPTHAAPPPQPPPPPRPALLMMPPVGRTLKQAGGFGLNAKQPPPAPTEASSNGSRNDSANKSGAQQCSSAAAVAGAAKNKKKGKAKAAAPGGVRLSSNPYGFTSSSSGESDAGGGGEVPTRNTLFSSDEEDEDGYDAGGAMRRGKREDETETLFSSSRSFSSDSTAAGGMESYYYRSSRSNSRSRRRRRKKAQQQQQRQQVKGGVGKCYSTARGGGGIVGSGRTGSIRFDLDDGFRPLVSLSCSTTTGTSMPTTAAAAAAQTATVAIATCLSTTSGTAGTGSSSAASTLSTSPSSDNKDDGLLTRRDDADVEGVSRSREKQQGEQVNEVSKKQGMSTGSVRKEAPTGTAAGEATTVTPEEDRGEQEDDNDEDGYAVVKESSDPYSDFRSSALEMIMERQLFGSGELERLLGAFLSLNDVSHHPVILHVFSEIWQALFDNS